MRIRTKILLLFTLGATVPFLVGNLFVVFGFSRMAEQRIGEELVHTASLASSRVGDRLERFLEDLENVSLSVPFRELMPVGQQMVRVRLPGDRQAHRVRLLAADQTVPVDVSDGYLSGTVPSVLDHEVVAIDLI